jgi:Amt family ammonium transporter
LSVAFGRRRGVFSKSFSNPKHCSYSLPRTATIVSGAVAERCRFRAYLIYSFFLTGFIYPVASHWIWSPDGFLNGKVLDFSGAGGVHLIGGAAAMAGSVFLGPRIGKFKFHESTQKWEAVDIPGHNAVLAALGAFILWMGFFAFNGAACAAFFCPSYSETGRIVTVTMLAGSSGCLTLLFFGVIRFGCWDLKLAINGLLSGMVASCSGCNVIDPWAALLVGFLGAFGYYGQVYLFEHVLRIDDPLGASAVHQAAGAVGLITTAFLANSDHVDNEDQAGIFYGGNGKQLGYQIMGLCCYFGWSFGTCAILFKSMDLMGILRVSAEVELQGMDMHHHGGRAYPEHDTVASKLDVSDSCSDSPVPTEAEIHQNRPTTIVAGAE